jgi:hypothetical protein
MYPAGTCGAAVMSVSNERSRYGSYALLHTSGFNCIVSTAPGFFKGSTLVMSVRPDGTVQRLPLAKAYLKRSLSKAERDAVHDYLVGSLDQFGNDKISLVYAIEGTFSVAKRED